MGIVIITKPLEECNFKLTDNGETICEKTDRKCCGESNCIDFLVYKRLYHTED